MTLRSFTILPASPNSAAKLGSSNSFPELGVATLGVAPTTTTNGVSKWSWTTGRRLRNPTAKLAVARSATLRDYYDVSITHRA